MKDWAWCNKAIMHINIVPSYTYKQKESTCSDKLTRFGSCMLSHANKMLTIFYILSQSAVQKYVFTYIQSCYCISTNDTYSNEL